MTNSDASAPFDGADGYKPRDQYAVLVLMILLSVTLNLVTLPLTQVVDPISRTFGIDDISFSVLMGAFFAVPSMVMSVLGGWLADRTSRRSLLLVATLLWTTGGVWSALAPTYEQLAAARILVAIGAGIKFPVAMTWINDAFPPDRRGKAIGAFFVVLGLGPAIGASVGGLVLQAGEAGGLSSLSLLGAGEPWRATLLVLALTNLLVAPWLLTLRDARPSRPVSNAPREARSSSAFPVGLLIAMVAAAGFLSLADTANLSWLPTVLRREYGFDARQTGLAFGVIATIAGAVGPIAGGVAGDAVFRRHGTQGRLWLCCASTFLCAPLFLSYVGKSSVVLVVALTLSGLLTVLALSLGYVAIQALLPPHRRGFATGLASATTQVFTAVAPTVVAFSSARMGGTGSLGGAVALVTIASFLAAAGIYGWTALRSRGWERSTFTAESSAGVAAHG